MLRSCGSKYDGWIPQFLSPDPDYSGPNDEVMVRVLNFTSTEVQVKSGDRLAQAVVLPAPRVSWQEVTEIREATRGGFGATGQ
jgi:dUTP diphosphatase